MGIVLEIGINRLHCWFNWLREGFNRLDALFNRIHPFFPQKNAPLTVIITVSGALYVLSYT